jgi:protein-S-isoprenylcysteine O-methyltransferase Ste14
MASAGGAPRSTAAFTACRKVHRSGGKRGRRAGTSWDEDGRPIVVTPGRAIVLLWVAWAVSWLGAAWWSASTQKSVGMRRELGYRVVLTTGALVLAYPAHGYEGDLRLWHIGLWGAWACVALMFAGFAFCWWARIHLGRLWSGQITRKADHRVVDTGPYGVVRHPIYTGILLAALATMAAKGTALGILGVALMGVGLWMKARLEEQWLRSELGAEAYDAYRRRVPMLVPFGPRGR